MNAGVSGVGSGGGCGGLQRGENGLGIVTVLSRGCAVWSVSGVCCGGVQRVINRLV